jgi:hypothetical protein
VISQSALENARSRSDIVIATKLARGDRVTFSRNGGQHENASPRRNGLRKPAAAELSA